MGGKAASYKEVAKADTTNSHMVSGAEQKERDTRETEQQDDERCWVPRPWLLAIDLPCG
jgi:hypothetical protein